MTIPCRQWRAYNSVPCSTMEMTLALSTHVTMVSDGQNLSPGTSREAVCKDIASTMNFLADRECRPGKTVQSCGLYLMLRSLDKHERRRVLQTHMTATDFRSNHVFEFIPRFEPESIEYWGRLPAAPDGKTKLVEDIVEIWVDQNGKFVLHKDGNTTNDCIDNLKWIDLAYAFKYIDTAKVDWHVNLSVKQSEYV